jgi:predicted metal-binding protein
MLHKIKSKISDDVLQKDLEKYRKSAIDFGATDSRIIAANQVVIDERVFAKCIYPRCPVYGISANCPPHNPDLGLIRKIASRFHHAVFFKLDAPSETLLKGDMIYKKKNLEIVSKIEALAFYDGYYLALGFGGASCKSVLCPEDPCTGLIPGKSCRYPYRARASMHGVGMDAFKMAVETGWDIYPVGNSTVSSDVPHVSHLGLVFIF